MTPYERVILGLAFAAVALLAVIGEELKMRRASRRGPYPLAPGVVLALVGLAVGFVTSGVIAALIARYATKPH